MSDRATCKDCGHDIVLSEDKALATGEYQTVWSDDNGWVCEVTGDEHAPEGPDSVYQRDLDSATEGLDASVVWDYDEVFNGLVDGMENLGHSRVRVERDLREWIEAEAEAEEPFTPMDPREAVTYAILAINTAEAPDATSGNDMLYLELNSERALAALDRIRDFLIASGEDLPDYVFGKDES